MEGKCYFDGEGKLPIIEDGKMSDIDFFRLTDMLDWDKQGDDEAVLEPLVSQLSQWGDKLIYAFEDKMAELLYSLDTYDIAKHMIGDEGYLSTDEFLYTRCLAMVNGLIFYNDIFEGKRKLPKDLDFESILYAPMMAWARAHGESYENYPHITPISHETYSNKEGWEKCNWRG